jgi:hypothetical protein
MTRRWELPIGVAGDLLEDEATSVDGDAGHGGEAATTAVDATSFWRAPGCRKSRPGPKLCACSSSRSRFACLGPLAFLAAFLGKALVAGSAGRLWRALNTFASSASSTASSATFTKGSSTGSSTACSTSAAALAMRSLWLLAPGSAYRRLALLCTTATDRSAEVGRFFSCTKAVVRAERIDAILSKRALRLPSCVKPEGGLVWATMLSEGSAAPVEESVFRKQVS